jgi:hypothetical protein
VDTLVDAAVHTAVAPDAADAAVVDAVVHAHIVVVVLALVAADLPRVRWKPNIYWRRCSAGSVAWFPFFPSSPPLSTWTLNVRQGPVPLWCSFLLLDLDFDVTCRCVFHFSSQQELRFLSKKSKVGSVRGEFIYTFNALPKLPQLPKYFMRWKSFIYPY